MLIYYAGHGQYSDDNQLAWWVPVDGNIDEPGSWILDAAIRNYVAVMRARHVYVIADSCFSGSLFAQTRAILPRLTDRYYAKLYAKRSRWGFTSGSTEPVADQGKDGHSVFAYHLLKFLRDNEEPYLVPSRIADSVIPLVARNADQMPRSQPLQNANDEGGQFILQLASAAQALREQSVKAEQAIRQERDKAQQELQKELERLAEDRRRIESDAKEKLERERAHLSNSSVSWKSSAVTRPTSSVNSRTNTGSVWKRNDRQPTPGGVVRQQNRRPGKELSPSSAALKKRPDAGRRRRRSSVKNSSGCWRSSNSVRRTRGVPWSRSRFGDGRRNGLQKRLPSEGRPRSLKKSRGKELPRRLSGGSDERATQSTYDVNAWKGTISGGGCAWHL